MPGSVGKRQRWTNESPISDTVEPPPKRLREAQAGRSRRIETSRGPKLGERDVSQHRRSRSKDHAFYSGRAVERRDTRGNDLSRQGDTYSSANDYPQKPFPRNSYSPHRSQALSASNISSSRPSDHLNPPPERSPKSAVRSRSHASITNHGSLSGTDESDTVAVHMRQLMGFSCFKSTKNTKVPGNNVGAVRKDKQTRYRQYMNRVGGFNRPLSPTR